MKWLRRTLLVVVGVLLLAIAGLLTALRYTASCPERALESAGSPRAVIYECYGGPEVLRIETVEKPVPGDDELLVRVEAAGVNPWTGTSCADRRISCD